MVTRQDEGRCKMLAAVPSTVCNATFARLNFSAASHLAHIGIGDKSAKLALDPLMD